MATEDERLQWRYEAVVETSSEKGEGLRFFAKVWRVIERGTVVGDEFEGEVTSRVHIGTTGRWSRRHDALAQARDLGVHDKASRRGHDDVTVVATFETTVQEGLRS